LGRANFRPVLKPEKASWNFRLEISAGKIKAGKKDLGGKTMTHEANVTENGLKCFCEVCTADYFDFLHSVRMTGKINMFGAGVPLRVAFPELSKEDSRKVLELWQNTFKKSRL
jgi:hypothetical protein